MQSTSSGHETDTHNYNKHRCQQGTCSFFCLFFYIFLSFFFIIQEVHFMLEIFVMLGEKQGMKENILLQITNASQMIKLEKDPHAAFALIIDGKTLSYALEDDLKLKFLGLAVDCASVICCRVSPKQKADV